MLRHPPIHKRVAFFLDSFCFGGGNPHIFDYRVFLFQIQPSYLIYRTMSLDGLILIFGLLFLVSSRIHMDKRLGMKNLFMAMPIRKGQYVAGKLLGGILFTFSVITIFLSLNMAIYIFCTPSKLPLIEYILPLLKTVVICGLPISCFIGCCAVLLPDLMDIRLFYLLFSVVFIINAMAVGSDNEMPFYLITSGDLLKLIWQHPKFVFDNFSSVLANLSFLLGCGLCSVMLVMANRKFWRAE